MKYALLAPILYVGICSFARAHTIRFAIDDVDPDSPAATLAAAKVFFAKNSLFTCISRVNGAGNGVTVHEGNFSITFNADDSATITWTKAPDDFVGIYVSGGNQGGQFYQLSSDVEHRAVVVAPANIDKHGRDHGPAEISHIDFFASPGGKIVPDSGATAILLGCGLAGVVIVRRLMNR
ncbi:MAG: VPDSG-CTERM sorting domain-containing protein [Verrucomicrobia bacterium]|nr:VPDSG-CTERM sorting domain-containing protein [Verrucomicrobiota bacterium]